MRYDDAKAREREGTREGLKSIGQVVELVGAVAQESRDGKGN